MFLPFIVSTPQFVFVLALHRTRAWIERNQTMDMSVTLTFVIRCNEKHSTCASAHTQPQATSATEIVDID